MGKKAQEEIDRSRGDSPLCMVKQSPVHGFGVFATQDIPEDDSIIEYVGEKVTKKESERRAWAQLEKAQKDGGAGVYIFTLNKRYDIDGNVPWNTARLINHSCDPNCAAHIEMGRIWIYALRDIGKGEELTFNYGFDLENYEDHPCRCGSKRCVGYIVGEEYWPELKKKLKKKAKAEKKKRKAKKKKRKKKTKARD